MPTVWNGPGHGQYTVWTAGEPRRDVLSSATQMMNKDVI